MFEKPLFESEELDHLDELGGEYVQELFNCGMIPALSLLDIDERLLEPDVSREFDYDFDRD